MHELFTVVNVPIYQPEYMQSLLMWFRTNDQTKFILLLDRESLTKSYTLEQIHKEYPEIKTVGFVSDPWDRVVYAYKKMQLNRFMIFDDFVLALANTPEKYKVVVTPQIKYLEYTEDKKITKTDYIIRTENVDADLRPLQEYFGTEKQLEDLPQSKGNVFKRFYSKKSKEIIEDMFKEDISTFGYTFD